MVSLQTFGKEKRNTFNSQGDPTDKSTPSTPTQDGVPGGCPDPSLTSYGPFVEPEYNRSGSDLRTESGSWSQRQKQWRYCLNSRHFTLLV